MAAGRKKAWSLPLDVADYLADTVHLSVEESGAYLHLLMHSWLRGGTLPDDDVILARCCKVASRRRWSRIRAALEPYFTIADGVWRQRRLVDEYERVTGRRAALSEGGRKGGLARHATGSQQANFRETSSNFAGVNVQSAPELTGQTEENQALSSSQAQARLKPGSSILELELEEDKKDGPQVDGEAHSFNDLAEVRPKTSEKAPEKAAPSKQKQRLSSSQASDKLFSEEFWPTWLRCGLPRNGKAKSAEYFRALSPADQQWAMSKIGTHAMHVAKTRRAGFQTFQSCWCQKWLSHRRFEDYGPPGDNVVPLLRAGGDA